MSPGTPGAEDVNVGPPTSAVLDSLSHLPGPAFYFIFVSKISSVMTTNLIGTHSSTVYSG